MKIRKVKKQNKYNVYNKHNKHSRILLNPQKEQTFDSFDSENKQNIIDNLLSDDSNYLTLDIVTNNSIPTNVDLPNSTIKDDAWLKLSLEIEAWENTPYLKLINE